MLSALLFTALAYASEAHEIPVFTSPALEALVDPIGEVATHLGTCPPVVKRVSAQIASGQVIENALNEYVSNLQVDRGRDYEFGLIAPVARTEERVRANLRALDESSPALATLARTVWATLLAQPSVSLESGTAVYSKRPDLEEPYDLRVILDRATNEFLLLAVGECG